MEISGLNGKVAIVSGAGAEGGGIGNGRAAAILLARAGARVVAVDRLSERVQPTVDMIRESGGEAVPAAADVTQEDDCRRAVERACELFGGVDILVNNVGVGSRHSVVDEDPARWDAVMRINVGSVFLMSKYSIPQIEQRGGGAVVNISSISALRPRGLTAYSASKGAVISLTRAMAVDHAAAGIRVNCVAPGPVYTPMVSAGGMTDEQRDKRRLAAPLEIEGTGWDVGNAVLFLASDLSRYITGQTLVVDGGVTLRASER
jgi:NAD(P)-dependent dehydrogenase (short-subunit alcohol dehydrogenase family)